MGGYGWEVRQVGQIDSTCRGQALNAAETWLPNASWAVTLRGQVTLDHRCHKQWGPRATARSLSRRVPVRGFRLCGWERRTQQWI